jgi:hypothetical protein
MSSEQRKIATDGNAYTWDEFVIYYPDGTQWYWDQAGWPEIETLDNRFLEVKPDNWSGEPIANAEEVLKVMEEIAAGGEMEEEDKPWKWKAFKWMMRVHWSLGQFDQVVSTLERCLEVATQDNDHKHAVRDKLPALVNALTQIGGGGAPESDSLFSAVLGLVQPKTLDMKTWMRMQFDLVTFLLNGHASAADVSSQHSLLEKILQLLDCADAELSGQAFSFMDPSRMQSFSLRSEAILYLAGATRWLQHLSSPAVPIFTNADGSTSTLLSQLTTDQLSLALLDSRLQAMVHFVLGCRLCESGASLNEQLGHFTHTAQSTGAAKPLRKAALEHVLMVMALKALESPRSIIIDIMGVKDIPPIEWLPEPAITHLFRKAQLAAVAADVHSFSKLEGLIKANINWQDPARALLQKPFNQACSLAAPRARASGADYAKYDTNKRWRLERLSAILLNPKHCTDRVDNGNTMGEADDAMSDSELNDLLSTAVPNLDKILFYGSSGGQPGMIRGFVTKTYMQGFPNYQKNTDLNETYIKMMRFIMKNVRTKSLTEQKVILGRLCKAFQDCQAVQSRMVQTTYDALKGRNLHTQVLALVDKYKVDETGILRRVVYELQGSEHGAALPHKEAGVVAAIGTNLGLPGTTSAKNDPHSTGCGDAARNEACFRKLFQVDELADWLAEDINSWDDNKPEAENLELYVGYKELSKFLSDMGGSSGDDASKAFANRCYHDDEQPELYSSTPNEAQEEQDRPFMHTDAAIEMLEYLFVPPALIHMDAFELGEPVAAAGEQ